MSFDFQATAFLIGSIWLIVLTLLFIHAQFGLKRLFKHGDEASFSKLLNELTKANQLQAKEVQLLVKRVEKLETSSLEYIQKIGLIRFNPFKDTGGEQSFILALTDSKDSGIVISGLYSRSGMRWYAKRVFEGKGIEHDLSEEEKKAIEAAK